MSKTAAIIGRILLGLIFVLAGAQKLMDIPGTAQALEGAGLPGGLAIVVGVFELLAGLFLAVGLMVRLVAILLFGFVALTILFFHHEFTDPVQGAMAIKNVAIMGGLMLAFAHSQMWSHYYAIRTERRGELATRDAEERARSGNPRCPRRGPGGSLGKGRGGYGWRRVRRNDDTPPQASLVRLVIAA